MATFSADSSVHDFFVSVLIRQAAKHFKGAELVWSDGALPLPDCVAEPPPSIDGYKPDAMLAVRSEDLIVVEAKSYADLFSDHSKRQFDILHRHLSVGIIKHIALGVFNIPDELELPVYLRWLSEDARCILFRLEPEGHL
jgi:hypothetical protein